MSADRHTRAQKLNALRALRFQFSLALTDFTATAVVAEINQSINQSNPSFKARQKRACVMRDGLQAKARDGSRVLTESSPIVHEHHMVPNLVECYLVVPTVPLC